MVRHWLAIAATRTGDGEFTMRALHDGDVASSPACAERFTESMLVSIPRAFHAP
jgi:hypothetical protein